MPIFKSADMNRKLLTVTRIITVVSSAALILSVFLPLWRIELSAPQYPEGLVLKIFPTKIAGDVDVVNGLNHYIGMRTLHTEDFFEFIILPWLIGLLAAFGLLTLIINRKWFFVAWTGFFVLFGIIAMFDFYRWEYNYGHNLDPAAAIRVPGMSYQPPLIGYKQLLNFGAYSIPDAGGWIFIGVALALITGLVLELRNTVTITRKLEIKTVAAAFVMFFSLASCSAGIEPIIKGKDGCDYCKMTISDLRFGGELITQKGRVYKFDDAHCIISFYEANASKTQYSRILFSDFDVPGKLINLKEAVLLKSDALRTPMGGNIAAFSSIANMEKRNELYKGQHTTWEQLIK